MRKKSQAAMEFLLTYGWAILVVLVVIGALAYFGVLDPSKLFPDKCYFGAFGACEDYTLVDDTNDAGEEQDSVVVSLVNNQGKPIRALRLDAKSGITCSDVEIGSSGGLIHINLGNSIIFKLREGKSFSDVANAFSSGDLDTIREAIYLIPSSESTEKFCSDPANSDFCAEWKPGEKAYFWLWNCQGLSTEERASIDVDLTYSFDGEFMHTIGSTIAAVPQENPFE
ncbi:MAG: hypothetical protein R6U32_01805 [Candidatus Woesearchaeota archaeon]